MFPNLRISTLSYKDKICRIHSHLPISCYQTRYYGKRTKKLCVLQVRDIINFFQSRGIKSEILRVLAKHGFPMVIYSICS